MAEHCHRVLVIEDDDAIREALRDLLQDEGYAVIEAKNGQEALTRLRKGPAPCLILLDLMMPVMNGWQFREAQVRDPALAEIPVIVVSADRSARDKIDMLHPAGYLPKPLGSDKLMDMISAQCQKEAGEGPAPSVHAAG